MGDMNDNLIQAGIRFLIRTALTADKRNGSAECLIQKFSGIFLTCATRILDCGQEKKKYPEF